MPQTVIGLGLLVLVGFPGILFLAVRESREPVRDLSALREGSTAIAAGAACDLLVAALFACFRLWRPAATPDVGRLIREGESYFRSHYVAFSWWAVVGVALGCLLALGAALAWVPLRDRLRRSPFGLVLGRIGPDIRNESGWAASFKLHPEADVFVGIEMVDGTYVYGALDSYSPQGDETADRSIVIAEPIDMRRAWMSEVERLDAKTVVVGAGEIRFISTYYLSRGEGSAA